MKRKITIVALAFGLLSVTSTAQYNSVAGKSRVAKTEIVEEYNAATGEMEEREVVVEDVERDGFGNADGSQYDLAVDGAFEGQTVVVVQLYPFGMENVRAALEQKGFSMVRFSGAPSPEELEEALDKACQFWLISDRTRHLNEEHLEVIEDFWSVGKGVYIWGDNEPYYADANYVTKHLINATMEGNLIGDKTVGIHREGRTSGLTADHLITTGLEYVYEGITIATIQGNDMLEPLVYGSAGNLVTATYEFEGKRLIIDGGFTRLYNKWDTAGTGRYVKNAAAWLVNFEKFGDEVLSEALKTDSEEEITDEIDRSVEN